MIVLETRRLLLRRLEPRDAPALLAVFGDPEAMRFSDHGVRDLPWVEGWLAGCLESYRQRGFGPYAVVERESGEVVGYCGLTHHPDLGGRPEVALGYRLARSRWGRGYASEAVAALLAYAIHTLRLRRVVAQIDPHNPASVRVAEKAGMRYERDLLLEGYTHPDRLYVVTAPP
ncbi:Acetyltransferase (GNAT) domain protein [Calidithermus terrae]|uniref:Acetyltransferase (GNAT) domain protein n=1 Tax=Calidithermus terrae TaxID=1408545 RepID=A0A399F576_9DEIN|nr:GNAT family N-acetyltransferase [Calidithermus terrae]RIH90429.1 Acetyltransferase (GNAT) domain protein [Calidithermus terrae]